MCSAHAPVQSEGVTDLPYFAWNRAEAERVQAQLHNWSRASDAQPSHEHEPELPGSQRAIPASDEA
jgi:hypothetical protein